MKTLPGLPTCGYRRVTKQLQRMEAEIGLPLLVRGPRRRVELTSAGERLLSFARETLARYEVLEQELATLKRYDLPLNYRTLQKNVLQETDRETLNTLASELIRPDEMAIVVVGDADVIRPELEELGMPITELDEDGFEIEGE